MVGQGDVAPSTGTVHGAACARSTCVAVLHIAAGADSWCRRDGFRLDLVAGSNDRVPQAIALQTTAAQMSSGTCRALLQRRYR